MGENAVLLLFVLLTAASGLGVVLSFRTLRLHETATLGRLAAGNALILLFLLSSVALAGESYLRFVHDTTDSFGLTKTTTRWFERHFTYNDKGLRDSIDYDLRRRAGARRITFLGDSFTAGHGIADVEDRFANRVRASMPGREVHVIAKRGFDTGIEIESLLRLVASGYQLDDVVLVYCLNDISDIVPEWQEILERIYDAPDPGPLVKHSYFLDWIYFRGFAAHDPDVSSYYGFVRDSYDGPVWEQQKARLRALRDAVDARGGRLHVVTFPFMNRLGPGYDFAPVHETLDTFWAEQGVPHLDLLDVFGPMTPGEVVVNRFDAHPNEHAHALAAEEITRFLDAP